MSCGSVAVGHAAGRDIIATASYDQTVRIWDAATGVELAVLDLLDPPSSLAVNGDRMVIAAGNAVIAARPSEAWSKDA